MIALVRFGLVGFAVLSVVYVSVWLYRRAAMRERAEAEWERRNIAGPRDRFVEKALARQARPLAIRLALLVYVLPLVTLTLIVYFTNQR